MHEYDILTPRCYHPNPDLVEYIREELRMKEIRRARENAGEGLSDNEKRFEKNLNKRKSTWMNKVFQITADLIFFLECIGAKPELREEFKDEYNDLFGFHVKEEYLHYTVALYENTFYRLISSILQIENTELPDSTTTATYIAQQAVYEKMRKVLDESGMRYTDPEIATKIIDDLQYNMAWIKFVAPPVHSKDYFRRIINYENPVLRDAKSP
jgi:hypothetical protein